MDWEDLKTFLAVARHGNLSAGARSLGVSQTTMGRRIDGLHDRLGAKLLQRSPSGIILTPAGEQILAGVERMESEAHAIEGAIKGTDVRLEGVVRITTVEAFGAKIITPALTKLQASHPGIAVELITDDRSLSLARREADIAIRLAPFEQHDAIVRHVADMAFALYGAAGYLDAFGRPDWSLGAEAHRVIALQDNMASVPEAIWLREIAPAASRALLANSRDVQVEGCRSGLGLACLPRYLADRVSNLVLLEVPSPPPIRPVWLGVHKDLRDTPRIRAVLQSLTDGMKAQASILMPKDKAV
jgi:DNA-binding transcriptional LysR family regulator